LTLHSTPHMCYTESVEGSRAVFVASIAPHLCTALPSTVWQQHKWGVLRLGTNMDSTKRCTRCGEIKPATVEFFNRDRSHLDGLRSDCKSCNHEYHRQYRAAHRDQVREYNKQYYDAHIEKAHESSKQYRVKNQEKVRSYSRQYRAVHRERTQEYNRQYRTSHREQGRRNNERYKTNHPDTIRAIWQRHRARKNGAAGSYTSEDIRIIYKSQQGKCWWCSCEVGNEYHIDHRIPLSRGGSNAPGNLVISCPKCNWRKNNKLPHEWNGRLL